ncbi:hypothetical protein [Nocardioides sp.]|uniref:hypothetical protein n=1 Tax=Nocardioides sp. TaxID=35761 RepID=UPI003D0A70FF
MNNNDFYDRRDGRAMPDEPTPQPQPDEAASALAVYRDPSVAEVAVKPEAQAQRGIAWVRPTELPTLVGAKWANRGIDLQAELVRRSRSAPVTAAKAGRRISRAAIARPEPPSPTVTTTEELGL